MGVIEVGNSDEGPMVGEIVGFELVGFNDGFLEGLMDGLLEGTMDGV